MGFARAGPIEGGCDSFIIYYNTGLLYFLANMPRALMGKVNL